MTRSTGSDTDLIKVPRGLLAAALYCVRKQAPDGNTYRELREFALSPAEPTYNGIPLSELAGGQFHPGDIA